MVEVVEEIYINCGGGDVRRKGEVFVWRKVEVSGGKVEECGRKMEASGLYIAEARGDKWRCVEGVKKTCMEESE